MALRTPAFNDARSYGFEWLRVLAELDLQEGVLAAGDFKVTAAAAGGMRVDVAAGTGLVKGDSGVPGAGLSQGLFLVVNDASIPNAVTLTAAHGTNPRLDQIVLTVRDSSDLGTGADDALIEVLTGTATAGVTLDNRNGAAALGNDKLLLADVLVPAAAASIVTANIRDRRKRARGFYRRIRRVTNAGGGSDYTTTSTAVAGVALDDTNMRPRIECAGNPIRMTLQGRGAHTAAGSLRLNPMVDGSFADWTNTNTPLGGVVASAGGETFLSAAWDFVPAAGSRLLSWNWYGQAAGTASLYARGDLPLLMTVEEILRDDSDNS